MVALMRFETPNGGVAYADVRKIMLILREGNDKEPRSRIYFDPRGKGMVEWLDVAGTPDEVAKKLAEAAEAAR